MKAVHSGRERDTLFVEQWRLLKTHRVYFFLCILAWHNLCAAPIATRKSQTVYGTILSQILIFPAAPSIPAPDFPCTTETSYFPCSQHSIVSMTVLLLEQRRQDKLSAEAMFQKKIYLAAKRRRDRRITRKALLNPRISPFAVLFGSGCDQSLITLCGFDHRSVRFVLQSFKAIYDFYSPYCTDGFLRLLPPNTVRRGRPRSLEAIQCLCLTLI